MLKTPPNGVLTGLVAPIRHRGDARWRPRRKRSCCGRGAYSENARGGLEMELLEARSGRGGTSRATMPTAGRRRAPEADMRRRRRAWFSEERKETNPEETNPPNPSETSTPPPLPPAKSLCVLCPSAASFPTPGEVLASPTETPETTPFKSPCLPPRWSSLEDALRSWPARRAPRVGAGFRRIRASAR